MAESGLKLSPYLQGLYSALNAIIEEAEGIITDSTHSQWCWSPDNETWSQAQVFDHLATVEKEVHPGLQRAIQTLREKNKLASGGFEYGGMERFFIKILSPNPPFRIPVPNLYRPKEVAYTNPMAQVGIVFLTTHKDFLALLPQAEGLDLKGIKVASPISPMIRLTLGCWFEGLVRHTEYHFGQVRALRSHPNFPKPTD